MMMRLDLEIGSIIIIFLVFTKSMEEHEHHQRKHELVNGMPPQMMPSNQQMCNQTCEEWNGNQDETDQTASSSSFPSDISSAHPPHAPHKIPIPIVCKQTGQKIKIPKQQMNGHLHVGKPKSTVSGPLRALAFGQGTLTELCTENAETLRAIGLTVILVIWHAFLGLASLHSLKHASGLLLFTGLCWLLWFYTEFLAGPLHSIARPLVEYCRRLWKQLPVRIALYSMVVGAIVTFLVLDTIKNRQRLFGLVGMGFYLGLMVLCSHSPAQIVWRPVFWGFLLQFIMGLLVLRWDWGSHQFNLFSESVLAFLEFSRNGTDFVYGFLSVPPNICGMNPVFAFQSAQVVVYFGAVVSLLYHFGIMQFVIKKMAWFVQVTLNTTATESLNACACIFLGMSESPMLIRPYLERMTASELHAVMTTGFSCIAGAVFATYISFGACPRYLLSATVMSAPGSLACSKILYPETEQSQLVSVEDLELPEGEESNALECISNGAVMAVELVLAILANLVVFLALLALMDSVLAWMGELVGMEGWSFELMLGYVFFPLAYMMGITEPSETFCVAQLMGTKTALNEFIAYKQLGQMVEQRKLSSRSAMIATYALCGFSNFTSIGIQLGVLGGMAPTRKRLLSRLALRALLAGSISCFMTASLAGVLVDSPIACQPRYGSSGERCFDVDQYIWENRTVGGGRHIEFK